MQSDQSAMVMRIHQRVMGMRGASIHRDTEMNRVRLARAGRIDELYPDLFSDDIPRSIIANVVDTAARDIAELMAPIPSLACSSRNMVSAADEKRASNKNKIGSNYLYHSRMRTRQIDFADHWIGSGFGTYIIEPDFKRCMPRIRVESPFGAYYFKNRNDEVMYYSKFQWTSVGEVLSQYPESRSVLMQVNGGDEQRWMAMPLEVIRYYDRDMMVVYLPGVNYHILAYALNPLDHCPVVVAERPKAGEELPRGALDDVVWIQLARSRMAALKLQLADEVVNAPWVVPDDVTSMPLGAGATWRSQTPGQIGKAPVHIAQDLFTLDGDMAQEAVQGARYPASRTGTPNASIITGQGVQALQGTLETQVQTAQLTFSDALERAISLCFQLDVALWPNDKKTIRGEFSGRPFELTYIPERDIGDSTECRVTYGFGAGQTPSQAIVTLLQLRSDDIIGRDTFRRQLGSAGLSLDPDEEQRQVDIQQLEDAAKQGLSALAQALGPMIQQGGDPMMALHAIASVIAARRKGTPVDEAIITAFDEQKQQQQAQAAQQQPSVPGAPPGGPPGPPGQPSQPGQPGQPPQGGQGGPSPFGDNGMPPGVAPGQAGMQPGGLPSQLQLMAQMRNGKVNNVATFSQRHAVTP